MKRLMILLAALGALVVFGIHEVLPSATQSDRGASKTSFVEQIQALKARGEYRAELWSAFFANREPTPRAPRTLDQGGENIGSAVPIPMLPFNDLGTTVGMTDDYYEDCGKPDPGGSGDVVYSFTATQHELVDISLCGYSTFDTKLYIYANVYTPGFPWACDDDYCPGFLSQLNGIMFSPGNTYYIVVDGWGGQSGDYSISVMRRQQTDPCPCAFTETEPNDSMPPIQTIFRGEEICGAISTPYDVDVIGLTLLSSSPITVTFEGNAGQLPCPGGLGLHPCAEILSEDGKVIAYLGDTTNQATTWTTDFKLGPFNYVIKIAGANNTMGPWTLRVDTAITPTMPPPEPRVTIQADSNHACLRWNGSYLPGEQMIVERSTNFNNWSPYDTVSAGVCSLNVSTTPTMQRSYFRLKAHGTRPKDPFIGSILTLSQPGDSVYSPDTEVGYFEVDAIEWGATLSNEVGIARLRAHGVGVSNGQWIDQDNRDLFNQGMLTPITDFTGRTLNIFGRDVHVQHIAFAKDSLTQVVSVVDGRGLNPSGDSTMFFHDSPVYLRPNVGVSCPWYRFFWWDWCPGTCCRLKTIAFCRSTGLGWNPACSGWWCAGDPRCWLGCPCQPVGPPAPCLPNCAPCTLVPDPRWPLMWWCMCASQTPPPNPPRCFFQIFVKCKFYECWDLWYDCECPGAPPCPTFPSWTQVPFVNRAMRADCEVDCELAR